MLTTAITDITPITTPSSVKTLRSLCAHRLDVAIRTASPKFMFDFRGIARLDPHPTIRPGRARSFKRFHPSGDGSGVAQSICKRPLSLLVSGKKNGPDFRRGRFSIQSSLRSEGRAELERYLRRELNDANRRIKPEEIAVRAG